MEAEPASIPAIANEKVAETSCVSQLMDKFTVFLGVFFPSLIFLLVKTRLSSKSVFSHTAQMWAGEVNLAPSLWRFLFIPAVTPTPPPPPPR